MVLTFKTLNIHIVYITPISHHLVDFLPKTDSPDQQQTRIINAPLRCFGSRSFGHVHEAPFSSYFENICSLISHLFLSSCSLFFHNMFGLTYKSSHRNLNSSTKQNNPPWSCLVHRFWKQPPKSDLYSAKLADGVPNFESPTFQGAYRTCLRSKLALPGIFASRIAPRSPATLDIDHITAWTLTSHLLQQIVLLVPSGSQLNVTLDYLPNNNMQLFYIKFRNRRNYWLRRYSLFHILRSNSLHIIPSSQPHTQ